MSYKLIKEFRSVCHRNEGFSGSSWGTQDLSVGVTYKIYIISARDINIPDQYACFWAVNTELKDSEPNILLLPWVKMEDFAKYFLTEEQLRDKKLVELGIS